MFPRSLITLLSLLIVCTQVAAEESRAPVWKLSLAVGEGVIENPLKGRDNGTTSLLPSFSYYGERFFVSNLTVGYSLLEQKNLYVDLVVRPNEDGIFFQLDRDDYTMASLSNILGSTGGAFGWTPENISRDISAVAGPSATFVTAPVDISFAYFQDITKVHYGSETHLSFDKQYPLFGGSFAWSLGAVQKDADLVNYYYHLRPEEAGRFAYSYTRQFPPDDVTDRYARIQFAYPLGKHFELKFAAKFNQFDLDGRNPLMIEKPETLSWFAGVQYSIGGDR
ncbi:MipA/OmpV family protein [Microbulbifer agarilyticus]|uniref:MipA/OmpV family protein n=1 Tax=Microbulbifer agarilyticus TaxID=260552 RepID=UPI001C967A8D|nr:MipA/OmpV family protein [Microbulbifer agarilyticus]MBY6211626.1 MipA/OmpV family protein [Microbulbifer agarilyticus]MCA0893355.1 MipA/OmpV family protein [Microbulbifer agarilyticus]